MDKYRSHLPQLSGKLFLTDGGMGTTLLFKEGLDLPYFCTFPLLTEQAGCEMLLEYFRGYIAIARDRGMGFFLDSGPTWRASADWGKKLGYSRTALAAINRQAIDLLGELREEFENEQTPVVISGCVGPRGDGYHPGKMMTAEEAERYHADQIGTFSTTIADQVTAMTMTYAEEAIGITLAALSAGIPAAISFTVETDGRLPTGQTIDDAIKVVDLATGSGPAYYMINCAHPSHFVDALPMGETRLSRIKGIRLNASALSHAELDEAKILDDGDPEVLGTLVGGLRRKFPQFTVVGGCCGTDLRHINCIAAHV